MCVFVRGINEGIYAKECFRQVPMIFHNNIVNGFQARVVDILVISTVRAAETCSQSTMLNTSSTGFVADVKRMNVAFSLWILGNTRTLQTNENWPSLLRDARERNLVRVVGKDLDETSGPVESLKDTIAKRKLQCDVHMSYKKNFEPCLS